MNFVFFGVKKSGISVFLVSVEYGAVVKIKPSQMEVAPLHRTVVISQSNNGLRVFGAKAVADVLN